METEHKKNALISALRELFLRVSELELNRRISLYRHKAGSGSATDISTPLGKHIDKLASRNAPAITSQPGQQKVQIATQNSSQQNPAEKPKKVHFKVGLVSQVLDGLSSHFKKSVARQEADQYMGEKLRKSTWSHIHSALMHARSGQVTTAKLHADIANQSLKEAAHYMNDDDYKKLCLETDKALKDLKNN